MDADKGSTTYISERLKKARAAYYKCGHQANTEGKRNSESTRAM